MTDYGRRHDRGILAAAILTPLTFLALYYARHLDDNRLSSWQWCFQDRGASGILLLILAGCLLSYVIAATVGRIRYRGAVLFVLSFLCASLFWTEPEVIVDASRYFGQAKYIELYGIRYFLDQWGKDIFAWTDMPLVPLLYGVVFRLIGEARICIQIFTTLLFSLSAVLTYLIGKELWDEEVGFCGGLFLLGMPYLYTQVPLMLVDIATMCFLLLSAFTVMKALRSGGAMILVSSFSVFLAFFSKYSAWLMLSLLPVIVLVNFMLERSKPRTERRTPTLLVRTSYIVFLSTLLIGPVVIYKLDVITGQMRLLMAYQKPGLGRWSESFISTFFFQVHPFITVAAAYSIFSALKKRDVRYVIAIWLVVLVILLRIGRIRYIITVLPMLSLAASYGLNGIKGVNLRRFIVACVVTSSLSVALFAYLPFMQKFSADNLRNAGRLLDSLPERYVEVFTLPPQEPVVGPAVSVALLDIFTRKVIIYNDESVLSPGEREKIKNSSLRFTIEYKNPSYYRRTGRIDEDTVVAVISDSAGDPLPAELQRRLADYSPTALFDKYEGIFHYRTAVRIFKKKERNESWRREK